MSRDLITEKHYSEVYKEKLFELWYKQGKPSRAIFHRRIPTDEANRLPNTQTIQNWIENEWRERGEALDELVMEELNSRLVYEKVEMLKRHAEAGQRMQTMAVEVLEKLEPDDFTSSSLIRLWAEGIRIERESVGIPQALEKMTKLSDEQLVDEIKEIFSHSTVEFEQIEDEV